MDRQTEYNFADYGKHDNPVNWESRSPESELSIFLRSDVLIQTNLLRAHDEVRGINYLF